MLHWWTYLRSMGSNFHEVIPGQLYRGATPEPKNLRKWHAKYGLKTWIDLRLPSDCDFGSPKPTARTRLYAAQRKACQELGIDHIRIPISDREPTADFDTDRCLRLMSDPTNQAVFIACQGGRHRAGKMVALYGQRFLGWDEDQVRDSLKQGGFYPNGHERFAKHLEKLLGFVLLLLCLVVPASGQYKAWSHGRVVIDTTADAAPVPEVRGDDSSHDIPLITSSAWETATPIAVSRHPWLKPNLPATYTQANREADSNTVRVELKALRKATARPKSVYGADSPSFDRSYWVPFGLAVASSCTDWHSTSGALERGGREANPVFRTNRGLGVRYGANVAATAAFLGYTAWLEHRGHRRVARILLWTLTGLRFTASAWNYSLRR